QDDVSFRPLSHSNLLTCVRVRLDVADRLLGAAFDRLPGGRLAFRWDLGWYRLGVTVVGQAEHFGTQRRAHPVTATALVIDGNPHAGVNSRCSSVRPRRI